MGVSEGVSVMVGVAGIGEGWRVGLFICSDTGAAVEAESTPHAEVTIINKARDMEVRKIFMVLILVGWCPHGDKSPRYA